MDFSRATSACHINTPRQLATSACERQRLASAASLGTRSSTEACCLAPDTALHWSMEASPPHLQLIVRIVCHIGITAIGNLACGRRSSADTEGNGGEPIKGLGWMHQRNHSTSCFLYPVSTTVLFMYHSPLCVRELAVREPKRSTTFGPNPSSVQECYQACE